MIFRAASSMSRRNNSQLRDTYGLCLDHRLRPWLERALHHKVHRPPQTVFEPELEAHVLGQARRLAEFDQDVYVAFRSGFVTCHGSEEGQGRNAKALFQLLPV